jgi:hypothetical protein
VPIFEVTLNGRGLWIAVDGKIHRVAFRVARVVEADGAAAAADQAVELVATDPRARPLPGRSAPDIAVETVVPARRMPAVQPGFRFFSDPP